MKRAAHIVAIFVSDAIDRTLYVAFGFLQVALGFLSITVCGNIRAVGRFADRALRLACRLVCEAFGFIYHFTHGVFLSAIWNEALCEG
jgi:hypothetical protein